MKRTLICASVLGWLLITGFWIADVTGATGGASFDGQDFRGVIAYSCDGNFNDFNDWAASPMALGVLAAAGLQNKLVHFHYDSIFIFSNPAWEAEHGLSVLGAAERFGFDRSRFFDCQRQREAAMVLSQWFAKTRFAAEKYRLMVFVNDFQVGQWDFDQTSVPQSVLVSPKFLVGDRQRIQFRLEGRGQYTYQGFARHFIDPALRKAKITRIYLVGVAWQMLDRFLMAFPEDPAADQAAFAAGEDRREPLRGW
ncbi:MAG: hypothetical protein ACUVQG_12530 [Thermogutta sp.]